jgi:hypothetical protein
MCNDNLDTVLYETGKIADPDPENKFRSGFLMCNTTCDQGFLSGSAWIRINLSCWIWIQEGKMLPTKIGKSKEISCFVPGAWASFVET